MSTYELYLILLGYISKRSDFEGESMKAVLLELYKRTEKSPLPRCKDCKYFEYDSVATVDGIPLIVAHEICSKWGDGCKTKEDGYCSLFEPQERGGIRNEYM